MEVFTARRRLSPWIPSYQDLNNEWMGLWEEKTEKELKKELKSR
jgi:hypothetical protein